MNQGPRWVLLMKKNRGGKSHATVPLKGQEQGQGKNGGGKSHATVPLKGQ